MDVISLQVVEQSPFSLSHQGLKPMLQLPKIQSHFQMLRGQHRQESTQVLSHTSATMVFSYSKSDISKSYLSGRHDL